MPDARRIVLVNRPEGLPSEDDFRLEDAPMPEPGPGEVLRRTIYLSVDPYMRSRMRATRGYADPVKLGSVMCGATVSEVLASDDPRFAPGDVVLGYDGWQTHAAGPADALRKVDPSRGPISYALGILGMPGLTAYVAMLDIGRPRPGETVVVSAAAGAVGSAAVQIARIAGARVVGIAGSDEKCAYVTEDLGAAACVNYKEKSVYGGLRRACKEGIDVYFESVGGETFEAVLRLANLGARIPLVGLISQYNATERPAGPSLVPVLEKRALIQGMIVRDHEDRREAFLDDMTRWLREGQATYRETIAEGLAAAPAAFIGLFRGANIGKQLVRISEDPTR